MFVLADFLRVKPLPRRIVKFFQYFRDRHRVNEVNERITYIALVLSNEEGEQGSGWGWGEADLEVDREVEKIISAIELSIERFHKHFLVILVWNVLRGVRLRAGVRRRQWFCLTLIIKVVRVSSRDIILSTLISNLERS